MMKRNIMTRAFVLDATNPLDRARRNAEFVVTHATVYPFRLPETSLVCVYCAETYAEPADFRKHMSEDHKSFEVRTAFAHYHNENYLKVDCTELACRFCSEQFERVDAVARHLHSKHDVKIDFETQLGLQPFKFVHNKLLCGVCDQNFPCMRQLSRHITTHISNHTCDLCGKPFSCNSALKCHIKLTHIDADRICRKCKKTFSSLEQKKEHVATSQSCWPYVCGHCNMRFTTWHMKETHLIEDHGQAKKTYPCSECDETFSSRWIYKRHFVATHAEVSFECSQCDRKFSNQRNLNEHIESHKGLKVHQCSVCSKKFLKKKYLQQHMWTHNEHRRFECEACNMKFTYRVSYKSHMKTYHLEDTGHE